MLNTFLFVLIPMLNTNNYTTHAEYEKGTKAFSECFFKVVLLFSSADLVRKGRAKAARRASERSPLFLHACPLLCHTVFECGNASFERLSLCFRLPLI